MPICPSCAVEIRETDRFCSNCGASLQRMAVAPPPLNLPKEEEKELIPSLELPKKEERRVVEEVHQTLDKEAQKEFLASLSNPYISFRSYALLVSVFGFIMFAIGTQIDPTHGGGALIMVGLLFGITGIAVFFLFGSRVAAVNKIRQSENIIIDWEFNQEDWERLKTEQLGEDKMRARTILIVISFFIFLIGAAFLVLTGFDEDGIWVFKFLMGFLAFMAVVARLSWVLPHRRRSRHDSGRVIITQSGLWLNGHFHIWEGAGARFDGFQIDNDKKILSLSYSMPSRQGRQEQVLHIPIPKTRFGEIERLNTLKDNKK